VFNFERSHVVSLSIAFLLFLSRRKNMKPARANRPSGTPTAAPTIVAIQSFVADASGNEETVAFDPVAEGAVRLEAVPDCPTEMAEVAELTEAVEGVAPSANIVPKPGMKVDDEQQLPS
jgi:hypothetical protein